MLLGLLIAKFGRKHALCVLGIRPVPPFVRGIFLFAFGSLERHREIKVNCANVHVISVARRKRRSAIHARRLGKLKSCTIVVQIGRKSPQKPYVLRRTFLFRMNSLDGESQGERCNWNIVGEGESSRLTKFDATKNRSRTPRKSHISARRALKSVARRD